MSKIIIMNSTFMYMQSLGMKREFDEIICNPNNKGKQIGNEIQYLVLDSGYRYVEI